MRTIEDIEREYELTRKDDEIIQKTGHIYEYKNEDKRRELRKEYIKLLPKNEQLALWLHSERCNYADCAFYSEIEGVKDNWNGYVHKDYLKRANKLLQITDDVDLIKNIVITVNHISI